MHTQTDIYSFRQQAHTHAPCLTHMWRKAVENTMSLCVLTVCVQWWFYEWINCLMALRATISTDTVVQLPLVIFAEAVVVLALNFQFSNYNSVHVSVWVCTYNGKATIQIGTICMERNMCMDLYALKHSNATKLYWKIFIKWFVHQKHQQNYFEQKLTRFFVEFIKIFLSVYLTSWWDQQNYCYIN